jgi:catechol 2,3-dioxygenase-like lactoylglutathione lyase family enzyme
MHFEHLILLCDDPSALRLFYEATLGLTAVADDSRDAFHVQLQTNTLTFERDPDQRGCRYHFAFMIPANRFDDGARWLAERVPLAADAAGRVRFQTGDWNADNVYFYDAAGNIAELIAHHTLPDTARETTAPFDAHCLLSVCELGVVVPDTERGAARLMALTGEGAFHWSPPTDFAPVGDARGLFIVVSEGREWFPDTGVTASPLPFVAVVSCADGARRRIDSGMLAHD